MCIRDRVIQSLFLGLLGAAFCQVEIYRRTNQRMFPVSYTHLDVYKRQLRGGALIIMMNDLVSTCTALAEHHRAAHSTEQRGGCLLYTSG